MRSNFLLYGSNGFVGSVIARRAVESGLRPILAGRSHEKVSAQADELGLDYHVFELNDDQALAAALDQVDLVLHCAGPYIHTFEPMVEACLRHGCHYLDITGEIPVLEQLAERDGRAQEAGIMILPAVGFDVVPTDCLAVHLKERLPTANRLRLAFHSVGPAGMPPGTARTMLEMLPYGIRVRRNGRIVPAPDMESRQIDFGDGLRPATRFTWGDLVTAYHSTGIRDIENFISIPGQLAASIAVIRYVKWIFKLPLVKRIVGPLLPVGSNPQERARTRTHVWGEVTDDQGSRAVSRLHGPEGGVEWTSLAALAAVKSALAGEITPGFQTPATAFGSDFVLEVDGVEREDQPLSAGSQDPAA